ncbi:MAG: hypothetical protein J3T61_03140 [Candidatus Brocadiales bacterium]|nr:hypothetical protein [Candidatus Bathyanammoxibius sp.]
MVVLLGVVVGRSRTVLVVGGAVMGWAVIDAGKNYQRLEGGRPPHALEWELYCP